MSMESAMPSIRQRHVLETIIAQILGIVKFTKQRDEKPRKPVRIPNREGRMRVWKVDTVHKPGTGAPAGRRENFADCVKK